MKAEDIKTLTEQSFISMRSDADIEQAIMKIKEMSEKVILCETTEDAEDMIVKMTKTRNSIPSILRAAYSDKDSHFDVASDIALMVSILRAGFVNPPSAVSPAQKAEAAERTDIFSRIIA